MNIRQMTDAPRSGIGCTSYTLDPVGPVTEERANDGNAIH